MEKKYISLIVESIKKLQEIIKFVKRNNKVNYFFINVMIYKKFFKTNSISIPKNVKLFFLDDLFHIADQIDNLFEYYNRKRTILKYVLKPSFYLINLKYIEKDKYLHTICNLLDGIENIEWLYNNLKEILKEGELTKPIMLLRGLNEEYFNTSIMSLKNCIITKSFLSQMENKMQYQMESVPLDFFYNQLLTLHFNDFETRKI